MPIIIDIAVISISCVTVYFAARKGFVEMLFRILGFALAFAIASAVTPVLCDSIYVNCIEPQAKAQLAQAAQTGEAKAAESVEQAVDRIYSFLPPYFSSYLESTGMKKEDTVEAVSGFAKTDSDLIAQGVADRIVRPVATSILRTILFMIILSLLMFAVKIISRFLRGVRKIPLVRQLNSFLGGVLGIFKAVLIIYILAIGVRLFVICTGNANAFINEGIISSTYLFNIFYKYNPLTLL